MSVVFEGCGFNKQTNNFFFFFFSSLPVEVTAFHKWGNSSARDIRNGAQTVSERSLGAACLGERVGRTCRQTFPLSFPSSLLFTSLSHSRSCHSPHHPPTHYPHQPNPSLTLTQHSTLSHPHTLAQYIHSCTVTYHPCKYQWTYQRIPLHGIQSRSLVG